MKHLVQYHNVATQGPLSPASRSRPARADDYYEVGTNKHLRDPRGAIVWCISGAGSPRAYFLEYVFAVDDVVVDGSSEDMNVSVRGRRGHTFRPHLALGALPWFRDFRRSQGNFAFGLSSIRDEFVTHLEPFLPQGYRFK